MVSDINLPTILRYSSRRQPLHKSFLCEKLRRAKKYDRIAGYFSSSLLEVAGEELETIEGKIRMICNSDLTAADVQTAKSAQIALRRSWCAYEPESFLEKPGEEEVRERYRRLYELLKSGKLEVKVLPDHAFGLIHGKAGVITLVDGAKTSFIGSANESKAAWQMNYEIIWEDASPQAVAWVQEEFEALWGSAFAFPLAEFVIEDLKRLSERRTLNSVQDWLSDKEEHRSPNPAPVVVEAPVYRKEAGLWQHQKYFVKFAFEEHNSPNGKARLILADQVGLGKTLQLAMTAELIALTGEKPVLIICPKTIIWQWQGEMRDLLDIPSAVWDGRRWTDEYNIVYPIFGPEGVLKCPRRIGIISSGLITRRSNVTDYLLSKEYECVILDEAHHARRRNLGEGRDGENPIPNNLLRFMYQIATRTRSLMMATATPVQLRPIEAWDLLDILSRKDESVFGNNFSRWRRSVEALDLILSSGSAPSTDEDQWDWIRNPLPPKYEHRDFEILRRNLNIGDEMCVVPGDFIMRYGPPERARLRNLFPRFVTEHNPFIRRIIRRTRKQLEEQLDPETNEPLLKPIPVELYGENERDAIILPPYLKEAYELAEEFCKIISQRMSGSGFLKTLLLRRVGSSIYAGLKTAERMLENWESIDVEEDEDIMFDDEESGDISDLSRTLTSQERVLLERFNSSLEANQERDPKYEVVYKHLIEQGWLNRGCIIFSQYRDSLDWLSEQLTEDLPQEVIAIYSGPSSSGILHSGKWFSKQRDELKAMVMRGEIRLMLGTDAASEGLNLQRLGALINLDLPWNPTRLEQRKGRIQRIGQIYDSVWIYNLRYKDSVEDRVHDLLSERLENIYNMFGQVPDVLEDAWIAVALGEKERAKKIIDELPKSHPFEIRYSKVEKVNWESCEKVLNNTEKKRILRQSW